MIAAAVAAAIVAAIAAAIAPPPSGVYHAPRANGTGGLTCLSAGAALPPPGIQPFSPFTGAIQTRLVYYTNASRLYSQRGRMHVLNFERSMHISRDLRTVTLQLHNSRRLDLSDTCIRACMSMCSTSSMQISRDLRTV